MKNFETAELKADVLKIGHHGASDASSKKFLESVNPDIAVISVGRDNKYGHPSLRIIRRLERMGIKIFRTDKDGDIRVISNKKSLTTF